jgi:hypothetical protein
VAPAKFDTAALSKTMRAADPAFQTAELIAPHHALSLRLIARTGIDRNASIRDWSDDGFDHVLRTAGLWARPTGGRCALWHDPIRCLNGVRADYADEVRAALNPEGWALIACRAGEGEALERALGRCFRKRETHRSRRLSRTGQIEPLDYVVFERIA